MHRDLRAFDDRSVPERELVVHRRDEMDALARELRPGPTSGPAPTTYMLGPTGTGKTMSARLVLERLRDRTAIETCYVNCWGTTSRHDLLHECVSVLVAPTPDNTSTGDLCRRLHTEPDWYRVVVLDEIDQLAGLDALYDLYEAPGLSLVLIANGEEQLWQGIDDRITSRVSAGHRIRFHPYDTPALMDILRKRSEHAGVGVDDAQLERIAQHAAGDARLAIRTLREAAENATGRYWVIEAEDVAAAIPDAERQLRRESIDRLGEHQRVVLDVVEECGPVRMSTLYGHYEDRVDEPRVERTVRTYLQKLIEYDLVESEGDKRGRQYRISDFGL